MENLILLFSEYFKDLVSSEWQWGLVATNLIVITGLLFLFKFKLGWLTGVSVHDELAEKDNPAFGIVIAFAFVSFFLIMSAAATGDDVISYGKELILMGAYGVSGMVMLFVSKVIFDKFAMSSFSLPEEIRKRNVAAAIVDGGNMFATALIVFTYMQWVKGTELNSILLVCYGWIMSQVLLSGLSFLRAKLYKSTDGSTLESIIKDGNIAVAIRYTCYKIAFAFTPLIAASHYPYQEDYSWWYASAIFISSILLGVSIKVITGLSKRIILPSVDYADEINRQRNTGLATIEGFLVLGITFASYGLLR